MVNELIRTEAAGCPVIAHVYDEIIAEVPKGQGDLRAFERLICELPPWATGLPLTTNGWRGKTQEGLTVGVGRFHGPRDISRPRADLTP